MTVMKLELFTSCENTSMTNTDSINNTSFPINYAAARVPIFNVDPLEKLTYAQLRDDDEF